MVETRLEVSKILMEAERSVRLGLYGLAESYIEDAQRMVNTLAANFPEVIA